MTTVIDDKVRQWKSMDSDISALFTQKTQALAQFNENTMVKGELDILEEGDNVFKLVGPVLMTIDLEEAKENVAKRVEFIETEISKLDAAIATKQGDQTGTTWSCELKDNNRSWTLIARHKPILGFWGSGSPGSGSGSNPAVMP